MCHKVGLENTSKISAILVAEVGILASSVIWMDHNSFEVQDHKSSFGSPTSHSPRTTCEVCWNKGDGDAMILNVDGSALTNPGKEGFGGLVRKHDGTFQFGFYGSVDWTIYLHHTFREGNAYDDVLSKLGTNNVDHLIVLQERPSSLSSALLADVV
ncbi:hypothetical protein MTR_6g445010 [Medicago truncatula]|uniref:RNase H type-1 domain-containing protein n=1 Tax=Medicago truncatula TaxID=3880 RepID=A0A072UAH9_MEDTR|nr:hypothetical protein MTR_6g445010 [Medicago truncatula]